MNQIPEPEELLEAECNAQGLYGLPEPLFAERAGAQASEAAPAVRAAPPPVPGSE